MADEGGGGRHNARDHNHNNDGRLLSSSSRGRRTVKSTKYYDLLDVPAHATRSEIRSAYRRWARKIHPDKNLNDDLNTAIRKFCNLSAAYRMLSDPTKRRRYDSTGTGTNAEDLTDSASGGATIDPIVFVAVLLRSKTVGLVCMWASSGWQPCSTPSSSLGVGTAACCCPLSRGRT